MVDILIAPLMLFLYCKICHNFVLLHIVLQNFLDYMFVLLHFLLIVLFQLFLQLVLKSEMFFHLLYSHLYLNYCLLQLLLLM